MEKIIRIEETIFKENKKEYPIYEGYQIITEKQSIKLGISNGQSCCENWGYYYTNDTIDDFVGSELKNISIVDEAFNKKNVKEIYEGGAMFINIETDKGVLEFVVYNEHNGYYGHEVVIISEQLNKKTTL